MIKFFNNYKIIFYLLNFSLIFLYLFPGSLIGQILYGSRKIQPQITPDFVVSSNHFYTFFLISVIGLFTFKKINHRTPMLSLANAFGRDDLINFEKKILNFLSKDHDFRLSYSAEPKIDGISTSLIYKNGEFKIGLSRGDGKEGEDITANLLTIKDIPKKIHSKDFPEEIDIRGEVYIQNSDFKNLKEKFANPRNAASGSLRQKNPNDTKKIPLKFIAYAFGYEKYLDIKNQVDFLKKLDSWGFKVNPLNKLKIGRAHV